jgi:cytochrome c556
MSPAELELQRAMRAINGDKPALRAALTDPANADVPKVKAEIAALKAAFTSAESFFKDQKADDAVGWAGDALKLVATIEAAASSAPPKWDGIRAASPKFSPICSRCHTARREQLPDGSYRFKARDSRAEYDTYLAAVRTAAMRGDAEALGALVTVDHVAVTGATGATVRGRAAQIASDKIAFGQMKIESFEMHATRFRSDGALMYAAGTGTHVIVDRSSGRKETDSFQYVDVLIRESDGHWRSQYFMNAPIPR